MELEETCSVDHFACCFASVVNYNALVFHNKNWVLVVVKLERHIFCALVGSDKVNNDPVDVDGACAAGFGERGGKWHGKVSLLGLSVVAAYLCIASIAVPTFAKSYDAN